MADSDKNRKKRSNRSSGSDLSSSFEKFSKSLDDHSRALNDFSKRFEETMSQFSQNVSSSARTSGSGSRSRGSEEALEDIHRDLDRSSKAQEAGLTTLQKTGKSLETVILNVGSLVVSEIKTAYTSVSNSYKAHLSTISSQMQMSNKEYTQMFNEASEYFRQSGLDKQWSPVDYAEAIDAVLGTGLRGESAQQLAFQNLVTNKLVPAISTNTTAYRRMSKVFGDEFSKNTSAFAKYTESILGAEGLSEGRFDAMLDTVNAQILYAAGGDEEKAETAQNNLTAVLSWMEKNNLDSQAFIDDLYSAATGQIGSASTMQFVWGAGTPQDVIESLLSSSGISQLLENYVAAYSQESDNVNAMVALTEALEGNTNQAYLASAYVKQGNDVRGISEELMNFLSGYNKDQVYSEQVDALKEGWYQTADDALTKQEENLTTWSSTAASSLARFDEALNTTIQTLGSLAQIWLFTKTAGSGSSSFLKGLFSNSSKVGEAAQTLSSQGVATKTALSSGSGITLGTSLAGGALISGGLVHGVVNGVEAYRNSEGDLIQTLLGALTGDTSGSRTAQNKLDEVRSKDDQWFDWSKVGNAATTYGLAGAGVGTLVGSAAGGVGAIPGAVLGGIAGAASGALVSMTEQIIKYRDTSEYVESALGSLSESITKTSGDLKSASSNYSKYSSALTEYESLRDQIAYSEMEGKTSEVSLLKTKLSLMESEIKLMMDEVGDASENAGKASALSDDYAEAYSMSQLGGLLLSNFSESEMKDLSKVNISKMSYEDLLSRLEIDSSTAEEIVKNAINAGYLKEEASDNQSDAFKKIVIDYGSANGYLKTNVKGSDYDSLAVNGSSSYLGLTKSEIKGQIGAASTARSSLYDNISTGLSNLQRMAEVDVETLKELNSIEALHGQLSSIFKSYEGLDVEGKSSLAELVGFDSVRDLMSANGFSEEVISLYENYIKDHGIGVKGWYKVGLNTVPYDNYLASLHKGEMVLTSNNADKLRNAASRGSGLDRVLSIVESLSSQDIRSRREETDQTRLDQSSHDSFRENLPQYDADQFSEVTDVLSNNFSKLIKEVSSETKISSESYKSLEKSLENLRIVAKTSPQESLDPKISDIYKKTSQGQEGRAKAETLSDASENLTVNRIVEAIGFQTDSIVGVLNSILDVLIRSSSGRGPLTSSISRSAVIFEGI